MPTELSTLTYDALHRIRNKLLDLSSRNRLLNFKETAQSIKILDELPYLAYKTLVTDNKKITLLPLKEQDDQNNSNFELPLKELTATVRHRESQLQTAYPAARLERRCKRLHQSAQTAIEETGSNLLYVAFGFLEWYENENSDVPFRAPLMLVPVQLERAKIDLKSNCYNYNLNYNQEDIEQNLSLANKLSKEFDLLLPELEEDTTPEKYIEDISRLVRGKERWRVSKEMVVGLFSFAKLFMYKDLDPDKWPDTNKINAHPKIMDILIGKEDSGSSTQTNYNEEYTIDNNPVAEGIPLILDADSSQHSAIIDAIEGHDLVIEGPPGTGKSQTIANLIASALFNDKTVLFIAEKKAALEVVRRRFDNVGLGDFCLELHSHKTHKMQLHADIKKRVNKLFNSSERELLRDLHDLKREREKLSSYVRTINIRLEPVDETIYNILWKAERYGAGIDTPVNFITFQNSLSFSRAFIQDCFDLVKDISDLYQEIPLEAMDTWAWFEPINILPGDEDLIKNTIASIIDGIKSTTEYLMGVKSSFGLPLDLTLSNLIELAKIDTTLAMTVPDSFNYDFAYKIVDIDLRYSMPATGDSLPGINDFDDLKSLIDEYNNQKYIYKNTLVGNAEVTTETIFQLSKYLAELLNYGYGDCKVNDIDNLINIANETCSLVDSMSTIATNNHIQKISAGDMASFGDFEYLSNVLGLISRAPADAEIHSYLRLTVPYASDLFTSTRRDLETLKHKLNEQSAFFVLSKTPGCRELKALIEQFKNYRGNLFSFLSSSYRKVRNKIKSFLADSQTIKSKDILERLNLLANIKEAVEKASNNAECRRELGPLYKGIETDWRRLEEHVLWSQQLRSTTMSQEVCKEIINNMALYSDIVSKYADKILNHTAQIATNLSILKVKIDKSTHCKTVVSLVHERANKIVDNKVLLQGTFDNSYTLNELLKVIAAFLKAQEVKRQVEIEDRFANLMGNEFKGVNTDIKHYLPTVEWLLTINKANFPSEIFVWLFRRDTLSRLKILNDVVLKTADFIKFYYEHLGQLTSKGKADLSRLCSGSINETPISILGDRLALCIRYMNYLILRSDYCSKVQMARSSGLTEICEELKNRRVVSKLLPEFYLASVYKSMSKEIIRKYPELSSFTRASHENSRARFIELDKKILKQRCEQIAAKVSIRKVPGGISVGLSGDFTDMALLKREFAKKKRHIPIRQLLKRAGNALQALKPCFMMSPISVAQYLEPGQVEFDLIVMDEASQIKPEDAIGAIARGSQLIVVGDPKQLPPTTFFESIDENIENYDETSELESTESILDGCLSIFKTRRLRWHYRSEHESLIAFSNQEFYDGDLIIFPSSETKKPYYGVSSHFVEGAKYQKGRNMKEAQVIVEAIINHFASHADYSLGVATFNREQRDLIEDLLYSQMKKESWIEKKIKESENLSEPFFIKNLENVQGDERDVIFISTTYGPDADNGKVYQRFGPVGGSTGWRRLNVIFTRAKKKVKVFTSMRPADIIINPNSQRGVISLKNYLEYCQSGCFTDRGIIGEREPGSDFEIAVSKIISGIGYKVIPQVGVAGYFIDLGILRPGTETEFILGIECDGATYHSSKSARDRDRLRQEILTSRGWTIHRIWSTDWFKNREKEVSRLISVIRETDKNKTVSAEHYPDIASGIEVQEQEDLASRLLRYREEKIKHEYPNQPTCILRDDMIDAFVKHKPTTMDEFRNKIPLNLRDKSDTGQKKFLEDIFGIIEDYI